MYLRVDRQPHPSHIETYMELIGWQCFNILPANHIASMNAAGLQPYEYKIILLINYYYDPFMDISCR